MNKSRNLPPALLADKTNISKQIRLEIQALSGPAPYAFLKQAIGAWTVIFVTITLAIHINNIGMSLIAILIVATRLNILGLLVHEQVHLLGLRGRFGNAWVNLLTAYPLGITVESYAKVHLSHHKHYFTENDPDFLRKSGKDWTFPMPIIHLIKLLLSDLTGLSFIKLLRNKSIKNIDYNHPYPTPRWLRPTFYVCLVTLLTYFKMWLIFLIYWMVPLVTILPLIIRFGAICEHIYNLPRAGIIESSPLIIPNWWERLILPNLNFTFHTYHHFFPGIPYCSLPKVHAIFKRENLLDEKAIFYGYSAYLKYLQTTISSSSNNRNSCNSFQKESNSQFQ